MRPVLVGLIAASAVVLISGGLLSHLEVWSLFVGFIAGGLLALAIVLRNESLEFTTWIRGADGQGRTVNALKPLLDESWEVRQCAELAGIDDHLLLSPSGIAYVIETKALAGRVSLDDGVLNQRFGDDPFAATRHDLLPRQDLVSRVAAEWSMRTRAPTPTMRTIVVVWGDFLDSMAEHDGVLYVAGGELADTLRRLEGTPTLRRLEGTPKARTRWA